MSESFSRTVEQGIFIGRTEEQTRFRKALLEMLQSDGIIQNIRRLFTPKRATRTTYVFLLHGEGGMGKTQLATRFRTIAQSDPAFRDRCTILWLDWERRRLLDRRLVARDSISPELLFDNFYTAFCDTGYERELEPYKRALYKRADVKRKVADLLVGSAERSSEGATWQRLGITGMAWLLREDDSAPPSTTLPNDSNATFWRILLSNEFTDLDSARTRILDYLAPHFTVEELDLFIMPHKALSTALAQGIRNVSHRKPLLIFQDTYEIADRADAWVRALIQKAGDSVFWVIAGRDNLADSRKYGESYFVGYRADFSSDVLRVMPLSEFSTADLQEYFGDQAPQRPISQSDARALHRATLGIPLAVREAAVIWKRGLPLSTIVSGIPEHTPREQVVKTMTERFLVHCLDDPLHPHDRMRLYALALVFQPDTALLSAMLQTDDLDATLSELERRHSFVFVERMKLHDSVAAFLTEYLRAPIHRVSATVREIHQRATNFLNARLQHLESELPMLDMRIADERWVSAMLSLIHHTTWLDETRAWNLLMSSLIGAVVYDRSVAERLVNTMHRNHDLLSGERSSHLKSLRDDIYATRWLWSGTDTTNMRHLLAEFYKAAQKGWIDDNCAAERSALLGYLRAQIAYYEKNYALALQDNIEVAERITPMMATLQALLAKGFEDLGYSLGYDDDGHAIASEPACIAYSQAITLGRASGDNFRRLGGVQREMGEFILALKNVQSAIEIEPENSSNWDKLAPIFELQGRYDEILEILQATVSLCSSKDEQVLLYRNIAGFQHLVGQYDAALRTYQQIIELSQDEPWGYAGSASIYATQVRMAEALQANQEALTRLESVTNSEKMALQLAAGNLYSMCGRTHEAHEAYLQVIALADDAQLSEPVKSVAAREAMCLAYLRLGDIANALAAGHRLVEMAPANAEAHFLIGVIEYQAEHNELALAHTLKAFRVSPNTPYLARQLALLQLAVGSIDDVLTTLTIATATTQPYLPPLFEPSAQRLLDKIEMDLETAGQGNVIDPDMLVGLLAVNLLQNDLQGAITSLKQLREVVTDWNTFLDENLATATPAMQLIVFLFVSSLTLNMRANAVIETSNFGIGPEWYTTVAGACRDVGWLDEALDLSHMALQLNPDDFGAHVILADIFLIRGQLDEAEQHISKAFTLASSPQDQEISSSALRQFGDALTRHHKLNDAQSAYELALAVDPTDSNAWADSGLTLENLGRYEQALVAYDSALEGDSTMAYVWRNKAGILLYELHRFDDALTNAERSLDLEPGSVRGLCLKCLALLHLDRTDEANAVLDHALALEAQSLTDWQARGQALVGLHRYNEALDSAEQALALDPNDEESQKLRAEALKALDKGESLSDAVNPPPPAPE